MDIASSDPSVTVSSSPDVDDERQSSTRPVSRQRRKSTSHLKAVPETLSLREEFKSAAMSFVQRHGIENSFGKGELEQRGQELLAELQQPEKFLGFAMVMLGNAIWKRRLLAVPFERRMLLLPHCLKHAEGCPAEYDEFGLDCERCGACSIADYKTRAEQLGYKVLVAEGSPIVLKIIVEGYVDGIVGVACLNVLEKAIDKVLMAGVPSFAIPLHSGDCKNTSMDEAWVWDVLDKYEPLPSPAEDSYVPLFRASNRMFAEEFSEILPVSRGAATGNDVLLAHTEQVSRDWLSSEGKRFRPFITLAAYHARVSGDAAVPSSSDGVSQFPLGVRRVAMAIEAFHKASLVHDDVQDGDQFRYGRETLHRIHGVGAAINIGDYLIGVGYHLLALAGCDAPADAVADVLQKMAQAHLRLCDGQGSEMAWNIDATLRMQPLDALKVYALKTSPAFEAALYAGLRLAGPMQDYEELVGPFARHVGVGFQILNDLKDWHGDQNNKLLAGQDAAALRPTLLLALALQHATPSQRADLERLIHQVHLTMADVGLMRRIFTATGAFEKAEALVDRSRERAEALADNVQPESLRRLLYFLIDTILTPEPGQEPAESNGMLLTLPVAQA